MWSLRVPPRGCTLSSTGHPPFSTQGGKRERAQDPAQGMDGAAVLGAAAFAGAGAALPTRGAAPGRQPHNRLRAPAPTAAPHRATGSQPRAGKRLRPRRPLPVVRRGQAAVRRGRYRRGRGSTGRLCPPRSRPSCSRGPPAPPGGTARLLAGRAVSQQGGAAGGERWDTGRVLGCWEGNADWDTEGCWTEM